MVYDRGYGVYVTETDMTIGDTTPTDYFNGLAVIFASKGVVNKPVYVNSVSTLNAVFGDDLAGFTNIQSCRDFINTGNGLWVTRVGIGVENYATLTGKFVFDNNTTTELKCSMIAGTQTAKSLEDDYGTDAVNLTSDDLDINLFKTSALASKESFKLMTKFPMDTSKLSVTISEDSDYVAGTDFNLTKVFRYTLSDVSTNEVFETFRFSMIDGILDIDTDENLFIENMFDKYSTYFVAKFGTDKFYDIDSPSAEHTVPPVTLKSMSITINQYEFTGTVDSYDSLTVNPFTYFYGDRSTYPAYVVFEGGYKTGTGKTTGIKETMQGFMKDLVYRRANIIGIYDSRPITNTNFRQNYMKLKTDLGFFIGTTLSFERDIVTIDWGYRTIGGKKLLLPESGHMASLLVNEARGNISTPFFNKGNLSPLFQQPLVVIDRKIEPYLLKAGINFSRKTNTGYLYFSGITSFLKEAPQKKIHTQMIKLFMINVAEANLEQFIGRFNDASVERDIVTILNNKFATVKNNFLVDMIISTQRPNLNSVIVTCKILPKGSVDYIEFNLVTYDDLTKMNEQ